MKVEVTKESKMRDLGLSLFDLATLAVKKKD